MQRTEQTASSLLNRMELLSYFKTPLLHPPLKYSSILLTGFQLLLQIFNMQRTEQTASSLLNRMELLSYFKTPLLHPPLKYSSILLTGFQLLLPKWDYWVRSE